MSEDLYPFGSIRHEVSDPRLPNANWNAVSFCVKLKVLSLFCP